MFEFLSKYVYTISFQGIKSRKFNSMFLVNCSNSGAEYRKSSAKMFVFCTRFRLGLRQNLFKLIEREKIPPNNIRNAVDSVWNVTKNVIDDFYRIVKSGTAV